MLERRIEQRQQSEEYPRLAFASGQGVIPLSERKTNNREQLTKDEYTKKYLVTELNDIVYNPANVKYGAIDRNKCGRGLISPIYVTFTTNEIPGFIERIVTSHDFQQRALRFEEGTVTKRQSVNPEDLVTLDILVAPKREEQQKIATYFDSLDHLITLHQRITPYFLKINAFVWEQRKLGDSCKLNGRIGFRGYTEKDIISKEAGGVLTFSPTNIVDNKLTIECKNTYITREKYDESPEIKISNGDILFVKTGSTLGKSALVAGLKEDASINPQIVVMRVEKDTENFMSNVLITDRVMKQVAAVKIGGAVPTMTETELKNFTYFAPAEKEEKKKIGDHFRTLDNLITLHQRKPYFWNKFIVIDWEQRKLGDVFKEYSEKNHTELPALTIIQGGGTVKREDSDRNLMYDKSNLSNYKMVRKDDFIVHLRSFEGGLEKASSDGIISPAYHTFHSDVADSRFYYPYFRSHEFIKHKLVPHVYGIRDGRSIDIDGMKTIEIPYTSTEEQQKIGDYLESIDHHITLHHHKLFIINGLKLFTAIQCKCYLLLNISNKNKKTKKEIKLMPELERVIEEKLIDQLVYGDSQWTYREDLKTEEDLWRNFKYILEQNNKDRLNGESLSDAEFEQVKNQLQFSSFYKAGEWLVGENGKVMVHVQRDTEKLHLVVMNHEHIAGGSSVYEVINQYSALKDEDDYYTVSRNRRFDVTLMINGLPMIHIELKNRQHSYMDGFNQIKKYISEGKFTGIFSAVQMFVVSNGVDTKYFAAASDTDLNAKFMSGWVDEKNNPVSDYLDFAKSVLRIPEAHEMIARYTVLDRDAKRLIILRPYQIHAIESIREASKIGKSGFVWHTTGSGKTLTSYKATRNLLMDIPSLDKTIFLIDRKDLDTQTSSAFLIVMMSIQLSSIFVRGAMRHWTFNGDLMRMMKTGNVQSAEPTCIMITMMSMRREKKSLQIIVVIYSNIPILRTSIIHIQIRRVIQQERETTKVIIGVLMSILIIRLSKKQKRKQIGSFVF